MLIPPFLIKGDIIAIAATARKITAYELEYTKKTIQEKGYRVMLAPHIYGDYNQFAGTDEMRKSDLQTLINDPEVKAIMIARGGYGTMRIIDDIDFSPLFQHPKWFIGYSDITVLHSALHLLKIGSLHATMPINFEKNKEATDSLFNYIEGAGLNYSYSYENSANAPFYRSGSVTAPVVGGNLSLLYALQGSVTDIDTQGKILFIEDLDEYLYHIDRMILSLKRSGKLKGLAGLIVGGMSDMKDNTIPYGKNAEQIIAEHIAEYDFPVCFDFPCGHIDKNLALPLGICLSLNINNKQVSLSSVNNG